MPATKTNLTIEAGTDWSHGWAVTVNGEAIDDTWTARSQVRRSAGSATVLHEFTASVDEDGNVLIAVTPAETTVVRDEDGELVSGWEWTSGKYDVEVTNADESLTLRVAGPATTGVVPTTSVPPRSTASVRFMVPRSTTV